LETESLATVGEQERNSSMPTEWVKDLGYALGLSCDGHEEEMMVVFFFFFFFFFFFSDIEAKRDGRRAELVIDVSESLALEEFAS
jgi:hypothetical protein